MEACVTEVAAETEAALLVEEVDMLLEREELLPIEEEPMEAELCKGTLDREAGVKELGAGLAARAGLVGGLSDEEEVEPL